MEKSKIIFESYNTAIELSYEKYFNSFKKNKKLTKDFNVDEMDLQEQVRDDLKRWENTPIDDLNGLTPVEYFESIKDLNSLIQLFKIGAKISNQDLPGAFLDRLKSYGDEAVDTLLQLVSDKPLIDNSEEDYHIPLAAIKALGIWKIEKAVGPLIDTLFSLNADDEIFMEGIKEALVNIGAPSIEPIIEVLNSQEAINDPHEYLLIALSHIGERNKADRIYRCLKDAFLRMHNKALGAICLGDYGDGRAIPALRGYVEKNIGRIDRVIFYEIKSAVQRLGGNMDDIMYGQVP